MAGTATQTRPEPMNASPYHSKVKVTLKFADTEFAAGGMVTGKIELECKAEKGLGINVIMVELYAIEGEQSSPWDYTVVCPTCHLIVVRRAICLDGSPDNRPCSNSWDRFV